MTKNAVGGWQSPYSYPQIISREARKSLTKYMADHPDLSEGKARNIIFDEGLISLGYMKRPPSPSLKTPEQVRVENVEWCRDHWEEMSPKAKEYFLREYPELEPIIQATVKVSPS